MNPDELTSVSDSGDRMQLTPLQRQVRRDNMRRRPSTQLTKIILLVSFLILFGRLLYAAVASLSHHQERRQLQQVELSVDGEPAGPHETDLSP